jgi:hypothetical protein
MIKCILSKIWYDVHHLSNEMKCAIDTAFIIFLCIVIAATIAIGVTYCPVGFCIIVGIAILLFIAYKTCKYLRDVVNYCKERQ